MGFFSQMKKNFRSDSKKDGEEGEPPPAQGTGGPVENGHARFASPDESRGNDSPKRPEPRQTLSRDGFILVVSGSCPADMGRKQRWQKEDFEVIKAIGSGRNSMVYLAKCKHTQTKIALKVYPKAVMSAVHKQQVLREITIHSKLRHQYIIGLFAAWEDEKAYYLVQEFASGGDLFQELESSGGKMGEARAVREVVAPYLEVLSYLHAKGLIHRDIKPENSLFAEGSILKVADFGLSIDTRLENPVTRLGTLDYMAPEVLVCPDKSSSKTAEVVQRRYDGMVDAWAMGVLAYELITGRAPFEGESRDKTCAKIMSGTLKLPPQITDLAADFIRRALHKHTIKRLSVTDMMTHPWIVKHTGGVEVHPGHNIRERQLETNHSMPAWAINKIIDDAMGEGGASPSASPSSSSQGPAPLGSMSAEHIAKSAGGLATSIGGGTKPLVNKRLLAAQQQTTLGKVKSLDRSTREVLHSIVKDEASGSGSSSSGGSSAAKPAGGF